MLSANQRMLCELVSVGLDDFLESEALYRKDGKLVEKMGYLRRGKIEPFETLREMWPSINDTDVQWWLTYERGPEFMTSASVAIGLNFQREPAFYIGLEYDYADFKFDKFPQLICALREILATQNYRRP